MNKKMKWSIISISTATALTFGGLVVNNQKILSNTNYKPENDSIQNNDSSSNMDEWQTDDYYSEDHGESYDEQDSDEGGYNQNSWGQDEFQQAPSSGFEQGHGSSGVSR